MKILICDDDHSTVEVLTSQLDFEAMGIDTVLKAYNGQASMEIAEKEHPEIILCDIDMPQANGIDVLKKVHDLGFFCAFSFLTAYESFSYAKEAIRYGAVNYLTKPFTMEEVTNAVEGMAEYVDRHYRSLQQEEKARTAGEDGSSALAERDRRDEINSQLRAIRDGFYGNALESVKQTMERRNLPFQATDLFRVVSIRVDLENEKTAGWDPQLLRYSFRYLAQEAVADRLDFSYFLVDPDGAIDYIQLFIKASKFTVNDLEKRCRTLIRLSQQNLGTAPVCYIGAEKPLYLLSSALEDKQKIEQLRLQTGKIFICGTEEEEALEEQQELSLETETILPLIQKRDKASFMKNVGDLVERISESGSGSETRIAKLHHDLIETLFQSLNDNQLQPQRLFKDPTMRELDQNAERSVFDFIRFSSRFYDETIAALEELDAETDILANVKKYIAEHYREDIDRNDIAQVAYITPNYLSKRFRQDTGMSLRDYINQLRVTESKRLLVTTNMPVSTIAMEVGFGNISYFSTVFKKYTGVSPVDWRDNPLSKAREKRE